MSTSLLFHAFGVKGFQLKKTEFKNGEVVFYLDQDPHELRCSLFKSTKVLRRGKRERKVTSVPIGKKKTFISFPHQRVECIECGAIRYVKVNFVEKNKQHTRSFKNFAVNLLRFSTIKDVANILGVGWDLIKEIDKTALKQYENPPLKELKKIAIDEIYLGKKSKFITIVLDIDSGTIVYVGKGKDAESLDEFWRKLKKSGASIEAVASDMSGAYIKAVEENIPKAVHVSDHFHVVKLLNEKLTELRRELHNEIEDKTGKKY